MASAGRLGESAATLLACLNTEVPDARRHRCPLSQRAGRHRPAMAVEPVQGRHPGWRLGRRGGNQRRRVHDLDAPAALLHGAAPLATWVCSPRCETQKRETEPSRQVEVRASPPGSLADQRSRDVRHSEPILGRPISLKYAYVASKNSTSLVRSSASPSGTTITIPCRARVKSTRYAFFR